MNPTQQLGVKLDEAFAAGESEPLYRWLWRYVALVLWLRTGEKDEDFVAEAVNYLLLNKTAFRGDCNFSSWVFKIVSRRAIDWNKKRRQKAQCEVGLEAADRLGSEESLGEGSLKLLKLAERLPEDEQAIVQLYLKGLTQTEIAEVIHYHQQGVFKKWKRILRHLKELANETESRQQGEVL
jgi:RNA polymerase sigma factor (sigma-70 family)